MNPLVAALTSLVSINPDRLSVSCPFCKALPSNPCIVIQTGQARQPHAVRKYGV